MKRTFLILFSVGLLFCAAPRAKAQDFIGRQKVWNYWDSSGLLVGTRYVSTCNGYQDIVFGVASGASMTLAEYQPCDNPIRQVAPTSTALFPKWCTYGYYTFGPDGQVTGIDLLPLGTCVWKN
jgi:hypothetical protein